MVSLSLSLRIQPPPRDSDRKGKKLFLKNRNTVAIRAKKTGNGVVFPVSRSRISLEMA